MLSHFALGVWSDWRCCVGAGLLEFLRLRGSGASGHGVEMVSVSILELGEWGIGRGVDEGVSVSSRALRQAKQPLIASRSNVL